MVSQEYDCTVPDLVALAPCVKCLSRKELFALLVVILADLEGYTLPDDNAELLEDSACFRCLSDREKLNSFVSSIVEETRDGFSIEDLRDEIKCVLCWDENTLKSALTLLFCQTTGLVVAVPPT